MLIERGAKSLVSFPAARENDLWVEPVKELARRGLVRSIEIGKIDGEPAGDSPIGATLIDQGFVKAYKGLTWNPPSR